MGNRDSMKRAFFVLLMMPFIFGFRSSTGIVQAGENGSANQPSPSAITPDTLNSPRDWEHKGFVDGKSALLQKTLPAGWCGCCLGGLGAAVAPTHPVVPGIAASVGCLGGWAAGYVD